MGSTSLFAAEVSVAVTSNFDFTLDELKQEFEALSGHKVIAVPGPSAQHYGEILQGAAYDIFLSEDEMRPRSPGKTGQDYSRTHVLPMPMPGWYFGVLITVN